MKLIGISDVSVGYGSPEVPALMDSVCGLFGARGLLIEPDEVSRPPVRLDWSPAFDIKRLRTDFTDHSRAWHATFRREAMKVVNTQRPDVLILFGSAVFPALMLSSTALGKIIYHGYEFISQLSPSDVAAHKYLLDKVDLMIAPEVERLIIDLENIGTRPRATAPIYNVADVSYPHPVATRPTGERNGHFIYYGTLHRNQSLANYFWDPVLADYRFELFGRITDPKREEVEAQLLATANVRYHGVVDAAELNRERSKASFSLVWWNPKLGPGYFFVPPNRFFTSIQAHVPPICAPHPQCVTIIKRYDCGLVMEDWSLSSVKATLGKALTLLGTAKYDRLVAGCKDAIDTELNWDAQFQRLVPKLSNLVPKAWIGSSSIGLEKLNGARRIH